ncbi:MAG: NarK/NasA family nitrate transporter [Fimbriimonadaceae bacterium]|nr:NarK/NasA family nitrate transporter [Fimbriimonadaceae bacterium]
MSSRRQANRILAMNTLAFTVCFAVWTMYGVLVTFLADNRLVALDKAQIGWLIGIPILTGSLLRLPVGMLTDRYGGKPVYVTLMLFAAASTTLVSFANGFWGLFWAGLMFGSSGAAFAVGIAYSSLWFPRERQGTALGIFGVGNAGAALTTLGAPTLLQRLTDGGKHLEGWRQLPLIYAAVLALMALVFAFATQNRRLADAQRKTWRNSLLPLRQVRVWRFGAYYFLVFGAFVALAQWLVPYYLNVYGMSLAMAGMLASVFSLPSGVIRALGGWASDKFGARTTMYWVLSACAVFFLLLVAPRMDLTSPGEGVMAERAGVVTDVESGTIKIGDQSYPLRGKPASDGVREPEGTLILPAFRSWHEPVVEPGQAVKKKELLARGVTHVYFQANVWVFTALVFLAGIMMGVGKAAVYKHIPEYFPNDVGVVGGLVGVIGGLGGFFCPIVFGYLLRWSGLWTSCWLFLALFSIGCLVWMHLVILKMGRKQDAPSVSLDGRTVPLPSLTEAPTAVPAGRP